MFGARPHCPVPSPNRLFVAPRKVAAAAVALLGYRRVTKLREESFVTLVVTGRWRRIRGQRDFGTDSR